MAEDKQELDEQKPKSIRVSKKDVMCPHSFPLKIKQIAKFDLFARWTAIRSLGKRFHKDDRERIGMTDEDDEVLLTCENQDQFAAAVKIPTQTLSRWKNQYHEHFNQRLLWYCDHWLGQRTPMVFQSWMKGLHQRPTAEMIKLYLQYKHKWVPKEETEHSGSINITFNRVPPSQNSPKKVILAEQVEEVGDVKSD